MKLTPENMLNVARQDNPTIRYTLRVEPCVDGGAVLGAFCKNAGGFIPVAIETHKGSCQWTRLPNSYLEIDGKAVDIEPEKWKE